MIALLMFFSLASAHNDCAPALAPAPSPLRDLHARASRQFDAVQKFAGDDAYFAPIAAAARAAIGKHHAQYEMSVISKRDFPRHAAILKAIADFDSQKPKFSLYKIKRAIEGRYSLREYAGCRE